MSKLKSGSFFSIAKTITPLAIMLVGACTLAGLALDKSRKEGEFKETLMQDPIVEQYREIGIEEAAYEYNLGNLSKDEYKGIIRYYNSKSFIDEVLKKPEMKEEAKILKSISQPYTIPLFSAAGVMALGGAMFWVNEHKAQKEFMAEVTGDNKNKKEELQDEDEME